MRRKTWYLIMLFMPLLLPVVLFQLGVELDYETWMAGTTLVRFFVIYYLMNWLPYVIFSIGIIVWCRKKTADQIKKASWWMPWIFMPICGLFFLVTFMIEYPEGSGMMAALTMAAICVPVGFMYVFIVHGLTWAMAKLHWVKD